MPKKGKAGLEGLTQMTVDALEELKAKNIVCLDVRELTDVMDLMVVASGTSRRHVSALADNLVEQAKANDMRPLGVEGDAVSGWILVDLGDATVHLMSEEMREFYQLEKLWSVSPA